ncbi:hypothetical protein Lalb_Chr08g0234581 [Lupinus albus]|uniref:Uncharacterized protein n=1 Tax=Lupinus albus TaxID=3870 RepID=A0A6A4Q3B8_LUPAL|nr:hypothetical protein Lalb_Chr08g0234581 [Lupinus albus]
MPDWLIGKSTIQKVCQTTDGDLATKREDESNSEHTSSGLSCSLAISHLSQWFSTFISLSFLMLL